MDKIWGLPVREVDALPGEDVYRNLRTGHPRTRPPMFRQFLITRELIEDAGGRHPRAGNRWLQIFGRVYRMTHRYRRGAYVCTYCPPLTEEEQGMFKFNNGDPVSDKVTGFSGTVTGRADYITGCRTYLVQPAMKDGAWVDSRWLDEDRLAAGSGERVELEVETNGPGDEPPRR